jgi:hypothetical protein
MKKRLRPASRGSPAVAIAAADAYVSTATGHPFATDSPTAIAANFTVPAESAANHQGS